MRKLLWVVVIVVVVVVLGAVLCLLLGKQRPGTVKDEALAAGRDAASLPAADEDYMQDMDYGLTKNHEALRAALDPFLPGITADDAYRRVVRGRNNWNIWTGGNDRFWDKLSPTSFGTI